MQLSLICFLPDVTLTIWIETDEIWMCVGIADPSDELAANTNYDVFLWTVNHPNPKVADSSLVKRFLTNQAEVWSIVQHFSDSLFCNFKFL